MKKIKNIVLVSFYIVFMTSTVISNAGTPKMSVQVLSVSDAYEYLVKNVVISPYIKYSDLLENGKYNKNDARYSDITHDGEMNWSSKEYKNIDYSISHNDIYGKIQLDGKKISLPLKFDYFGVAYKNFAQIEFSKIKSIKSSYGVRILDEKNYTYLASFYIDDEKEKYFMLYNKDKQNKLILVLDTSSKIQNKIKGIYSTVNEFATKSDIRIKGIGIGNTYNEMYKVFGKPLAYEDMGDKTMAYYPCVDEISRKMYLVYFGHDKGIINSVSKNTVLPRKNVITNVLIVSIPYMESLMDYENIMEIIEDNEKNVLVKQAKL